MAMSQAQPGLGARQLDRIEMSAGPGIVVARSGGRFAKPVRSDVTVDANSHRLCVSLEGSMVYASGGRSGSGMLSQGSMIYMAGGARTLGLLSRGRHSWVEITWQRQACLALDDWLCRHRSQAVACRSLLGPASGSTQRTEAAVDLLKEGSPLGTPVTLALLHELLGSLFAQPASGILAEAPQEAAPALLSLMAQVKARPADEWSLKQAAAATEYSAFHLSRTFRAAVGYGFPEFVDRCRTEVAVRLLLESEEDLPEVAEEAGFGSVQGLRSACKEYLGLLPSEIRTRLRPRPALRA
jgi:AraC-like DNA-binding protein